MSLNIYKNVFLVSIFYHFSSLRSVSSFIKLLDLK